MDGGSWRADGHKEVCLPGQLETILSSLFLLPPWGRGVCSVGVVSLAAPEVRPEV